MLAISIVQKIIKRHRFEAISANWLDSSKYDNANIQRRNADDEFRTVASFVDKISAISKDYWQLSQDFAIDEQFNPRKGRHRCRCFNPKKTCKFHFIMFCLNDSNSGYKYKFFLYRDKDENRPEDMSAISYSVHVLTKKDIRLHHKGHICNVDNWYTSIPMLACICIQLVFVGTIKSKLKGLPKDGMIGNDDDMLVSSTQMQGKSPI